MACSSKFTHPATDHIIHYIKPIYIFFLAHSVRSSPPRMGSQIEMTGYED